MDINKMVLSTTNVGEEFMIIKTINKVYEGLLKIIHYMLVVLMTALVVVVFSNFASRYFFDFALAWAEETARFIFIWASFLGGILAYANNEHMGFSLLATSLSSRSRHILLIITNAIVLGILGILIKGGMTIMVQNIDWLSPALEISYGFVYSIVPIGFFILALQTLAKMYRHVISLRGGQKG